jgi:hypothetical protein
MAAEGGELEAINQLYRRPAYDASFATVQNEGELTSNTFDSCRIMEMVYIIINDE